MIFDRQIGCWGDENQEQITKAKIFVAGIGGLGCLLSEILVRSGIGKIYLCDNGYIEETDLNRQIFYKQENVSQKKIIVAEKHLSGIHSYSEIVSIDADVNDEAFSIPEDADGIIDCLDNFKSRFSLWEKVKPGRFFVHSGVENFFGQVITLVKGGSSGLAKLFGNVSREERIIPVNAACVSVIASLAANEVLKNIFNKPALLNKLMVIDLSDYTFDKINVR